MAASQLLAQHRPPPAGPRVLWVGAGTKDTGFSLTRLTFQITHATDADTNIERDFIIAELSSIHVIGELIGVSRRAALVRARQPLRDRWRTQHGGSRD